MSSRTSRMGLCAVSTLLALAVSACEEPVDLTVPTTDEVREYYSSVTDLADVEINGNVAMIVIRQSADQLRRGGTLWAKVGPYIYLFSAETHELFLDFPGLAGVRVVTEAAGGPTVANALLRRDELTDVLWRRALNISGQARRDGTGRITLIEDLIEWGEDHTEFQYNERYTQRR